MATQQESLVAKPLRSFLKTLPYCWFFRCHGLFAGFPDYMGVVNGAFFALEVKRDAKAKRSKLQEYTLKKIAAAGGYTAFVYPENMEEIQKQLEELVWRRR